MSRQWTPEQMDAIWKEGTNIIVSAGAGSGKTAVLTERIIRKLKQGVSIDQLIVVTFTKAAAAEMKERIRKAIKKDPALQDNLEKLDQAYITTFDSLALSIVKKYHYLLNVSSHVSIVESSILTLEKRKFVDEIFQERYQKKDPNFLKMIEDLCLKDDRDIRQYVLTMNDKLDMRYDKITYLKHYIEQMQTSGVVQERILQFTELLREKIHLIKLLLNQIAPYLEEPYYMRLENSFHELVVANQYDEIKRSLQVLKIPPIPKESDEVAVALKKKLSEAVKEVKELCLYKNESEIMASLTATQPYIEVMIDLILQLDEKLHEYKFQHDLYEFVDIFKMAIQVFEEHPEERREFQESIHEILVDEYQDTNDLGERFLNLISQNNVYMVGDIKQSIYRFRNANPYIFKTKYDRYRQLDGGIKIDLNKNFRSRREVLDTINLIFNSIMNDRIGGADYLVEHQMSFGNTLYETKGALGQNQNMEIYNYTYDRSLGFTRDEIEIFLIARDIQKKVEEGYQIFDKDTLEIRPIHYSDFVILLDRTTSFDLYKRIFEYLKVPLFLYRDELITDATSVVLLKNLLNLVVSVQQHLPYEAYKHCMVSVLRSVLYEYSDQEIFEIVTEERFDTTDLYQRILRLSRCADTTSISRFLEQLLFEFHFYEAIIKLGNLEKEMKAMESVLAIADTITTAGYTIADFCQYLTDVFLSDTALKVPISQTGGDACKIMTIHKSKGLEYHVCYYAGCHAKFNKQELRERFLYDTEFGIIAPYFDKGIRSTIYKDLLKERYNQEEISEKLRLLYVALTRSKEKMIIVADLHQDTVSLSDDSGVVTDLVRLRYTSFEDVLVSIQEKLKPYIWNVDIDELSLTKNYNLTRGRYYQDKIPASDMVIEQRSLTIQSEVVEQTHFSKTISKPITEEEKRNLEEGIYFHQLFELLDLKHSNICELPVDEFHRKKLEAFLQNPLLQQIEEATIYKEYEFLYQKEGQQRHGIIDLLLIYPERVVLVDYKLHHVYEEQYVSQLHGYREYIEQKTGKPVETYLYSILEEKEYVIV